MDISLWQIALILIGWILVAALSAPLRELLRSIGRLLTGTLRLVADGLNRAMPLLATASESAQHYAHLFWGGVGSLLSVVLAGLADLGRTLRDHAQYVLTLLPASSKPRGLLVFGYLLYLIAFLAFAFADMAQATNSRSVMYVGLEVPAFLQDLTIPLLLASGGTALMLGTIIGDFLARTDLVPWSILPRWARDVTLFVAVATFIFTLALMTLFALVRVPELVSGALPEAMVQQIRVLAAFADSLVIVPLLITTLLLFWGLFGLLVIYYFLVWALLLITKLLDAVFSLLRSATPILGNGTATIVRIVFALLGAIMTFARWLCETFSTIVEHGIDLLERILDLVSYPLMRPASRVSRYFREDETGQPT